MPFTRPDGASMVPEHALSAPGSSFEERRATARAEMARSEKVAAAVALRAAGYDVDAAPRGALVETVAIDVRAGEQRCADGDVIVEAAGERCGRRTTCGAPSGRRRRASPSRSACAVTGEQRAHRADDRGAGRPGAPDHRHPGRAGRGIELPVKVDIDLGDVGGPSAGLPFALDVFQELGNDIDRGYRVAATGEIELDGTVAPIGGMKQKVLGVREAGADVFLVPAGDNAERRGDMQGTFA